MLESCLDLLFQLKVFSTQFGQHDVYDEIDEQENKVVENVVKEIEEMRGCKVKISIYVH